MSITDQDPPIPVTLWGSHPKKGIKFINHGQIMGILSLEGLLKSIKNGTPHLAQVVFSAKKNPGLKLQAMSPLRWIPPPFEVWALTCCFARRSGPPPVVTWLWALSRGLYNDPKPLIDTSTQLKSINIHQLHLQNSTATFKYICTENIIEC